MLIPLNVVARGGMRDSTYADTSRTADNFLVPDNQVPAFSRAGIRVAGKEPLLYPGLGLELSFWFERQWRLTSDSYGYSDTLNISPNVNLYWLYAGLNYAWTNSGQKISFAFTGGGSIDADRFSAWRLGGVLPLVSEFPLTLPGYYYEELTATRFQHFYTTTKSPWKPLIAEISGWRRPRLISIICEVMNSAAVGRPASAAVCPLPQRAKNLKSFCAMAVDSTPSVTAGRAGKASGCCSNTILKSGNK